MDLDNKEESAAPVVAEPIKPAAPKASVKSGSECTRDTRGEDACAVKDCENCN